MLLFVCVTLWRYMRIGENLLKEVPVEKSILVDFDQFITFVNKLKAKWVHEGYSLLKKKKKNTKTTPVSAVLPPSDLLFLLRGQLQGFVRVLSMKISTNQSHNEFYKKGPNVSFCLGSTSYLCLLNRIVFSYLAYFYIVWSTTTELDLSWPYPSS